MEKLIQAFKTQKYLCVIFSKVFFNISFISLRCHPVFHTRSETIMIVNYLIFA